jgi:hypothetical protein
MSFASSVHESQRVKNGEVMKRTPISEAAKQEPEEMLPEYNFDYSQARPNRFANKAASDRLTITLDPDVAAVFQTPEAVNAVLRALIATMPQTIRQ